MDYVVVSGGVDAKTSKIISEKAGYGFVDVELKKFANGEQYVRYNESIRGKNVIIIQFLNENADYSFNDAIFELFLLIDAAKRASAKEVTVILPYYPYSRGDRKAKNREPISAALFTRLLSFLNINRIITIDLHSQQIQGLFYGPVDHITAYPIILENIKKLIKGEGGDFIIVSPDSGRLKESEEYANDLNLPVIFLPKKRNKNDSSVVEREELGFRVEGKNCIIIDDMIDTGKTILTAVDILNKAGARKNYIFTTHGIFSGTACEDFKDSTIDRIYTTNTIPQEGNKKEIGEKLVVMDISDLVAETIRAVANNESLSFLFNNKNNK